MKKLLILITILAFIFTFYPLVSTVQALTERTPCAGKYPVSGSQVNPNSEKCDPGLSCKPVTPPSTYFTCQPQTSVEKTLGVISPPDFISRLGFGSFGIGNVLSKFLLLIYIVASIVFVFMIVISALQWITSGGDKEAVGKARGRLTYAIIGITLLALAFVIIKTIGDFLGFKFFTFP